MRLEVRIAFDSSTFELFFQRNTSHLNSAIVNRRLSFSRVPSLLCARQACPRVFLPGMRIETCPSVCVRSLHPFVLDLVITQPTTDKSTVNLTFCNCLPSKGTIPKASVSTITRRAGCRRIRNQCPRRMEISFFSPLPLSCTLFPLARQRQLTHVVEDLRFTCCSCLHFLSK